MLAVVIGFLEIVAVASVIAFFLALTVEASVGFGYPLAFHAAVWAAMTFAISLGIVLLLEH